MNIKYERINFEFPYPIQHIVDFNFTCGYGEHPRLHLIGMVLEQDRDTILEKANSETAITLQDNKGKLLFHGYATNIQFRLEGGLHYLHLEAEGASSKLDIAKRSRTFFKQGITYKEIIKTVLHSYPGAGIDAHVKLDRKADFPIIQYQETDWEFLCRLASLFEAAILPDETATAPILEIGWKRKDSKEFLETNEITTVRDVLTCGKNFYGKDDQFSIKEKEQEEKYGEEYRFLLSAMPAIRMPDVINYTTKAFTSTTYYPVGTQLHINGAYLAITHAEGYTEGGEVRYDYIARNVEAIKTVYQDNERLAGASLTGTVKKCRGNMVTLDLDIDKDDGIKDDREDHYFTYAPETKAYYCMPVEGAKVHLYFPSGKEWEAIAVHSLRSTTAGAARQGKTEDPSVKSFSNDSGSTIDLSPDGITMSPDDGNQVKISLGKDGSVQVNGTDLSLSGENIVIGEGKEAGKQTANVNISAGDTLFLSRMKPSDEGMVPIEDHFVGVKSVSQIYSTGNIYHETTGPGLPVTPTYDDSELVAQEKKQAEDHNNQVANVLIERNREARANFV